MTSADANHPPAVPPATVSLPTLSQAIAQSAEAVVITDPEARIQYVNAAFETITGYTAAEVLGKNPSFLKSDKHDRDFYRRLWETLHRGETWRGSFFNRRKDGVVYEEESSIAPVFDERGALVHYVAVKRDISRERILEEQFLQSQKMEAVGRLAGSVAHDFNNLLTAIAGFASMALDGLPPASPVENDLRQILSAAQRASILTRKLLTFARHQVAQERLVNLNETLIESANLIRSLLGSGVELVILPGENLAAIKADPAQLTQAVMNLAVNSKDAMPRGGKLTILTANRVLLPTGDTMAADELTGDAVLLSVRDTGEGMSAEVKQHLFEPFFTTKDKGKGTGLGLATVYGIVKQCGGMVRVTSEAGAGAVFDLYFPAATGKAGTKTEMGIMPTSAPLTGGGETILLVEDEPALRELASRILRAHGYTVLDAGNGEEALRVAGRQPGPLHLLLTDVIMPIMGGLEIAVELRNARPGLRILFMSGYTDDLFLASPDLRQGTFFLQKPFTSKVLLASVRAALTETPQKDG